MLHRHPTIPEERVGFLYMLIREPTNKKNIDSFDSDIVSSSETVNDTYPPGTIRFVQSEIMTIVSSVVVWFRRLIFNVNLNDS